MRIVSLVPAATEIVHALGLGDRLAGVSHECDHPTTVRDLPRVTRSLMPHMNVHRVVPRCIRAVAAMIWLAPPAGTAPAADLVARAGADRVVVTEAGGAPVAEFVFADRAIGRPALRDLRAPGGTIVTRPCPPRPGIDADDHATMHPGVMLCFSDLSGADPWRHKTAVRVTACAPEPGLPGSAVITCTNDYLDTPDDRPTAGIVGRERSRITLSDRTVAGHAVRVVLWEGTLTPGEKPLVLGDVEEMGLGIRLVKELAPRAGACYRADHGGVNEKGVFGKPAAWVDAAGMTGQGRVGVLLVPAPGNPRVCRFHARDTGWLLANPVGSRAYGAAEPGGAVLEPGQSLTLRFALVLHGDVADDALAAIATGVWAAR
jgi:hypothetical protein